MKVTVDESLVFDFPPEYEILKWDEGTVHATLSRAWQFPCECQSCPSHQCKPTRRLTSCMSQRGCRVHPFDGLKAVDLVCLQGKSLFLVEVKDFNSPKQKTVQNFGDTKVLTHYVVSVAKKFRDTLFSLWCGSVMAAANLDEQVFATKCRKTATRVYLVFHFESPRVSYKTGLFADKKVVSLPVIKDALSKYLGVEMSGLLRVVDCDALQDHRMPINWSARRSK